MDRREYFLKIWSNVKHLKWHVTHSYILLGIEVVHVPVEMNYISMVFVPESGNFISMLLVYSLYLKKIQFLFFKKSNTFKFN
jgi:hypothetical protein